jgi:hypothetical protein
VKVKKVKVMNQQNQVTVKKVKVMNQQNQNSMDIA